MKPLNFKYRIYLARDLLLQSLSEVVRIISQGKVTELKS